MTEHVVVFTPQALGEEHQDWRARQEKQKNELRHLKAALDAAHARFADFYDLAPVGYITVSHQAVILQANLTTATLLGLPRDSLIGKALSDFALPPDAEICQHLCQRVAAGGGAQAGDLRLRQPDGQVVWFKLRAMAATDADGAAVIRMVLSDISERKQAEAALLASTRLRDAILDSVPSQIAVLDYHGVILAVNNVWHTFALDNTTAQPGHASFNPIGASYLDICRAAETDDAQKEASLARDGILQVIRGTATNFHMEYPCHSPTQLRWFSLAVTPLHVDNHAVVVTHTDITQRRLMELAAKDASELKFRLVADNTSDVVVIFGANKQIQYVSPACEKLFGYDEAEEINRSLEMISDLIHPEDRGGVFASLTNAMESKADDLMVSYRYKHGMGHYIWREDSIRFQYDAAGCVSGACVVARDITQRIAAEEEIRKLAYFDALTGLPNRVLLVDRLQQLVTVGTHTTDCMSLLYIDMDNFQRLRHTLGHDVGKLLLKLVAQRLSASVEHDDIVASLGGDEFMVVLVHLGSDPVAAAKRTHIVASYILATLGQPYQLGHLSYHCTASIGATLHQSPGGSVEDLMKQVDLAMHHAKAVGHNVLRFFDPDMVRGVQQRIVLEKDLRHAVEAHQFVLHYQAQVDGVSRVTGAEVLVRWQHPLRGLVMPGDFIGLAEETGVILALGHWVMEAACAQLVAWSQAPGLAHLSLAVNVSALQFAQTDFVEQVLRVVQQTGANPQQLKLELTESLLVGNVADIVGKMTLLKNSGIGFSLDDFGTGFSSLAYLSRLPLDQLKIDRSFVSDALASPDAAAIAQTIITLAHSLKLGVIAEGVETDAQRMFLADSGCHAYQGYLFSRPLSLVEFEAFVHKKASKTVMPEASRSDDLCH